MHGCTPRFSVPLVVLAVSLPALAQVPSFDDPPKLLAPKPPTPKERDRRAALHQYVLGVLCEREQRLFEALKAYEAAARLDPEAPAVFKAQVPLLAALDRGADALEACNKALALDPEDYAAWHLASRLHKALGQFPESQKALQRGLATDSIKDHPEAAQQMWLDLGGMHELADHHEPAIHALSKAAEILDHPDLLLEHGAFSRELIVSRAADTYERIGNLCRKAKKYPEAIAAYTKAQERAPEAVAARLNFSLAQLCAEQGRLEEALANLDAYLRRQPIGVEPYEMKVQLLNRMGRERDVLPWLVETAEHDRHNVGIKALLAKEYVRAKQWKEAEQTLLSLAEEAPNEDVYRSLFQLHQVTRTTDRSLALVNQTFTLASRKSSEPPNVLAALQAKAILAVLRGERGIAAELTRQAVEREAGSNKQQGLSLDTLQTLAVFADHYRYFDEAEDLYRAALKVAPPESETALYAGLFRTLWRARKYDVVLELCRAGLAKEGGANQLVFHMEHAKALARLDRLDDALRSVEVALKHAKEEQRFPIEHLRVRILAQAERFQEAEAACNHLLKRHVLPSDQQEVRYLLSNVYNAWKKLPECEAQLEWILRADPENATANNDLGYIWADQNKNLEQAETMIRRALEVDRAQRERAGLVGEDNAAYVDSLGWVLFRRGKAEEALRELQRAAKLPDGDDPVMWDHLGDVYQHLSRHEEARAAWRRALELYEQNRRRKSDERYQELQRKVNGDE
jgi:tetratricopeptide (TPR) repeat protein